MTTNATAGLLLEPGGRPGTPTLSHHLELTVNQPDPTAVLARIRQMADYWEQHLPEVIRTPAVVSALRAALESAPSVVSPPTERAAHACDSCEGVDPDTCLFNPDRPSGRAAEAELYVLLRKAGEGRYEAQALIDRHRDEVLRRLAVEAHGTGTQQPEAVCGHVNPEGGERCGLESGHDFHRCVVPLEVGETTVSWAPTEPAPVAQQPAAGDGKGAQR